MKVFGLSGRVLTLLIGIGVGIGWGCSSDCLQCHPKLKPLETDPKNPYYKQHHFLVTCTKCHPNHSGKEMEQCGADCFDCHSRQKLVNTPIPEHKKLKSCTKCHTPSIHDLLPTPTGSSSFLSPQPGPSTEPTTGR